MRFSPAVKLAGLAGLAVGTVASALLISSGSHTPAPTQVVIRQDAATGSISSAAVVTSSAPVKRVAAPKPAASTSSAAVQRPAFVQEAPVTDPTTASDAGSAAAPSSSPAPTFQPIKEHPGNGPSSVNAGSIPTPSPSGGN